MDEGPAALKPPVERPTGEAHAQYLSLDGWKVPQYVEGEATPLPVGGEEAVRQIIQYGFEGWSQAPRGLREVFRLRRMQWLVQDGFAFMVLKVKHEEGNKGELFARMAQSWHAVLETGFTAVQERWRVGPPVHHKQRMLDIVYGAVPLFLANCICVAFNHSFPDCRGMFDTPSFREYVVRVFTFWMYGVDPSEAHPTHLLSLWIRSGHFELHDPPTPRASPFPRFRTPSERAGSASPSTARHPTEVASPTVFSDAASATSTPATPRPAKLKHAVSFRDTKGGLLAGQRQLAQELAAIRKGGVVARAKEKGGVGKEVDAVVRKWRKQEGASEDEEGDGEGGDSKGKEADVKDLPTFRYPVPPVPTSIRVWWDLGSRKGAYRAHAMPSWDVMQRSPFLATYLQTKHHARHSLRVEKDVVPDNYEQVRHLHSHYARRYADISLSAERRLRDLSDNERSTASSLSRRIAHIADEHKDRLKSMRKEEAERKKAFADGLHDLAFHFEMLEGLCLTGQEVGGRKGPEAIEAQLKGMIEDTDRLLPLADRRTSAQILEWSVALRKKLEKLRRNSSWRPLQQPTCVMAEHLDKLFEEVVSILKYKSKRLPQGPAREELLSFTSTPAIMQLARSRTPDKIRGVKVDVTPLISKQVTTDGDGIEEGSEESDKEKGVVERDSPPGEPRGEGLLEEKGEEALFETVGTGVRVIPETPQPSFPPKKPPRKYPLSRRPNTARPMAVGVADLRQLPGAGRGAGTPSVR